MTPEIRRVHEQVTFAQFADKHDLRLLVIERHGRSVRSDARWYAKFDGVEVMERGMLAGLFGDGATPEAAVEDYKTRLAGERIAVNAYQPSRREIACPNEWLPEHQP